MPRFPFALNCLAALLVTSVVNADPSPPAKDKAPAVAPAKVEKKAYHLSTMIVKDVKAMEAFIAGEAETTRNDMMDALGKTFMPLMEKEGENGTVFDYPAIFIYQGASAEPDAKFKLSTGYPVKPGAKAIGEFKVKKVEGFRCASFYFTGSLTHFGDAYAELFAQVIKAGHKPTGQTRELYLFWDGEDSVNTVVEIQVGIEAAKKADDKKDAKGADAKAKDDQARRDTTTLVIARIENRIEMFYLHVGRYPLTLAELHSIPADEKASEKWRGPYVVDKELIDAWSNELAYTVRAEAKAGKKYRLSSNGPDGKAGTSDDISNTRD